VKELSGMGYGMNSVGIETLSSVWGFLLNLLIILLIVAVVVILLNKSGYATPKDNERIVRMEKDIEEIKKTVEEIKSKLEEI
jgi:hypothetical protein